MIINQLFPGLTCGFFERWFSISSLHIVTSAPSIIIVLLLCVFSFFLFFKNIFQFFKTKIDDNKTKLLNNIIFAVLGIFLTFFLLISTILIEYSFCIATSGPTRVGPQIQL